MLTWIEISKSALYHNLKQYKTILNPQTKILAVVKSNAYGHGQEVSKIIESKIDWFGTVNLDEALFLRTQGIKKPILVLSYFELDKNKLLQALRLKIRLPVYSLSSAQFLNNLARNEKFKFLIHFKLDTGVARLGLIGVEGIKTLQTITNLKNLQIEGVFSHFAASEELPKYTQRQLDKFNIFLRAIKNINIPIKHFACSAAALLFPASQYEMIRLGLGLYGFWPSVSTQKQVQKSYPHFYLRPALSWKTKIIQIKKLPTNTPIGYGCSYKVKRPTTLGILPVGYYEGYDRSLSNQGEVLVKGSRCKVLGRVCMNIMMVDLTGIKNPRVGETVVLLGNDKPQKITAEELAIKCNTINYEIISRINIGLSRLIVE